MSEPQQFRIADSFSDSLTKLNHQEQKAVKTTAFDLQLNPANPGFQFHRLDRSKDPNFWSVRVNRDVRIIVHRNDGNLLLCYVDHHDEAYAWAERRKLERHPWTGAAQFVEIREVVREQEIVVTVPTFESPVEPDSDADRLPFESRSEEDLLAWGVPPEWILEVQAATIDWLLNHYENLPSEAAEALLAVAAGEEPAPAPVLEPDADPFDHPDAQRRFRSADGREELELALDFPWDKWTVFLHPAQRDLVERDFNGPARVAGSAGTGKTVVALHRAVQLTRDDPTARTLLTTYSDALAQQLDERLRILAGNQPSVVERIDVQALGQVAERLSRGRLPAASTASAADLRLLVESGRQEFGVEFAPNWTWHEWLDVVDAWNLRTWEEYRDVQRKGRRSRIGVQQREALWPVFERVLGNLNQQNQVTSAQRLHALAEAFEKESRKPYRYLVADESQDLGVPELRFLGALGTEADNSLFFAGDLGQRIFQPPFSWKSLGIDVRGRSRTLRINYRTSHQIRTRADRLLPPVVQDVDGNEERRLGTTSMFNGPRPTVHLFEDADAEQEQAALWLRELLAGSEDGDTEKQGGGSRGIVPEQIAIFVRSEAQLDRAVDVVRAAGAEATQLDESRKIERGRVVVATMHLAKGMEFRAVAVIACDEDVLPDGERLASAGDPGELEELYTTERHLLYVACTRARERLWVSGVDPGSEFLEDLG